MLVNDLDRKIKRGKERVEMKVEESVSISFNNNLKYRMNYTSNFQ